MNIKTIGLKLAGGLLAAAVVVTALAGSAGPASANDPNCKLGPCAPADTRPDLAVTNLGEWKLPNGMPFVTFTIKNQGASQAGPFKYRVLINGQEWVTNPVPSLSAGGVVVWGSGIPAFKLPPGSKVASFQVVLDVDDEVDESNEFNNTALASIFY